MTLLVAEEREQPEGKWLERKARRDASTFPRKKRLGVHSVLLENQAEPREARDKQRVYVLCCKDFACMYIQFPQEAIAHSHCAAEPTSIP